MKKLVFSTFAVVAISSVSMANNQFETNKNVFNSENMSIFFTECETWAMDQMLLRDPNDQLPPEESHNDYRSLVELCDSH
ncbi:MAG TPA: hypothetical protein VJ304_06270 [Flavobacterium sp.]|nr:hypothetical protein [Flavobacterium sp.]